MNEFADHFSRGAAAYVAFRPGYPPALFAWLAEISAARHRAWDCGTGSGQGALALATHFTDVIATDPSVSQLREALRTSNVTYAAMTAERSGIVSGSVELVTVAQALHWFRLREFYEEVRRVCRPDGVLAVWSYSLLKIDPAIDERITRFYRDDVGAWWPAERARVDRGYAGLPFPFHEIAAPPFAMEAEWDLPRLAGYLGTWSAVTRYRKERGQDPVPAFIASLRDVWGPSAQGSRIVRWPLAIRVGRVTR